MISERDGVVGGSFVLLVLPQFYRHLVVLNPVCLLYTPAHLLCHLCVHLIYDGRDSVWLAGT